MEQGISNHSKTAGFVSRMLREPPFRLFSRMAVKYLGSSLRAKAAWDAVERPNYLVGLLQAADQARSDGIPEIYAIEFGVAAGNGLVALQEYAAEVEKETGVKIRVVGFDCGDGLPSLCGDFRDHPDQWRPNDYPMDEKKLRARLGARTELILGNVAETVPAFVARQVAPIGFVSFDLDLYSSTMDAFQIFTAPGHQMLRRTPLYFDDINFYFNHEFGGELLAIKEFNERQSQFRIDRWRSLHKNRIFHEHAWLENMYVAHDIDAISNYALSRAPSQHATPY